MLPELDPLFARFQEALAGRYSLERELGRGGMGVVYLAHEVRLERLVAIKVLPPHLAVHAPLRERFLREARTAAQLSHPNIVPIHAVDEAGDFVYYAMAYVPGETLAHRVEARGPLPPAEATRVLREVAWALAYAHAQGIVHRDIKPENVLLEQGTGRAMVADFGIATVEGATRESEPGQILGTPEFMSPEQASGEKVDGRSDLYALGALGFYLLSGKPPFSGSSAARILAQHLTAPVPSLAAAVPGLPDALPRILERCLAKEPDQRPRSGEQLAEELGVVLQANPEPPAVLRAFLRRFKLSLIGTSATVMSCVVVFMFSQGLPTLMSIIAGATIGLLVTAAVLAYAIPVQLQQLRETGYGPTDVADTADALARRGREEASFFARWSPFGSLRGAQRLLWLWFVLFLLEGLSRLFEPGDSLRDLFYVGLFAAATIGQMMTVRAFGSAPEAGSSITGRFWRSRLIAWWWRRLTGAAPVPSSALSHRPTAIRLGLTVDELFAALPLEVTRQLNDVLPLVRRLEARSQGIRKRLEQLDQSLAEARRGADETAALGDRAAVINDLGIARAATEARLEAVVAALENIRLDLLRLRAGDGTMERITADVAAAMEIAAQTERLLEGRDEVARLLQDR